MFSFFLRPSNNNKNKNKIQGKTFLLVALLGDWPLFFSLPSRALLLPHSFPFLFFLLFSFSLFFLFFFPRRTRNLSSSTLFLLLSSSLLLSLIRTSLSYLSFSHLSFSDVLQTSPPIFSSNLLPSFLPFSSLFIPFQRQPRIIIIISCILSVGSIL